MIYMVSKNSTEDLAFRVALEHILTERGYGSAKPIAQDSGLTSGYLSQIRAGSRNPTAETQRKIAKAAGYTYVDFLTLGMGILDKEEGRAGTGNLFVEPDKAEGIKVTDISPEAVIERMRSELEMQKSLLEAKDEIIGMLKEKLSRFESSTVEEQGFHQSGNGH